jgi:putative ABC transport system permease protein
MKFHWLRRKNEELDAEIRSHLDEAIRDRLARGEAPEEARANALREFGNVGLVKEVTREMWGWASLERLGQDLRFGLRMLRKNPGFTWIAVVTLALGIGTSTAIFSVVKPVLFDSLPYPQANRLVMIWEGQKDGGRNDGTFGLYRALVERSRSFASLAVMRSWQPTLTGATEPERLDGQRVSASYFRTLGVAPVLGRDFLETDDLPNTPNVAIISDGLWRRRFNGDRALVGQQIKINDNSYTVIGVMPGGFENVLTPTAAIWAPLQYDPALPAQGREWGHHLRTLGRLQPAATAEQARQELNQILRDLVTVYPKALADGGIPAKLIVNMLQDDITSGVKPALLAILGAVLLLLGIACVNVTNLLLARGAQRHGEFALRAALGAGRTQILRQMLTESLLLSLLGGALGMLAAQFGVSALVMLSPIDLPRVGAIRLNAAALTFGLSVTTLIGLAVGLIPALQSARSNLQGGLQQRSGRTAGGQQRTRHALVVAEVALALVLLVSAGLLMRSLQQLFAISPGFEPAQLLTMQVQVSAQRFNKEATEQFFAASLTAVRQLPGVVAAAFTNQLPMSEDRDEWGVRFDQGADGQPEQRNSSSFRYGVSPGYFETMGIPLRRGRLLDERDAASAPPVAVISESLARRKFGQQDPLGRRLRIGGRPDAPWYTVVGVVGDVKQASLIASQSDAVYVTTTQWYFADNLQSLVVRTRGNTATLAPALRHAIWAVDKDQPISRVATMESLLAATASACGWRLVHSGEMSSC